jgi:hypothetical protein
MSESDVAFAARRRLGSTLRGKYRLDRLLGVGGMAVVYAATHRNGREFAVKMLRPEISIDSDVRARFLREGYVANAVKHPGAVAVLDDDIAEDGAAFLVMELIEGQTVEALWQQAGHRLGLDRVLVVGAQLLDVLGAAHARGIVHRDIKPANLFATQDGRVKVLDFGIARLRDAALSATSATQTGMMMGTPAFMAPEQALARSSAIDGRTDLWAVGATLFSLLSGRTVHEAENAQHLLVKAATEPPRPLASVAPEVPPPIAQVVDRALAFDPAARWGEAASMANAWHEAFVRVFSAGAVDAALARGMRSDGFVTMSAPASGEAASAPGSAGTLLAPGPPLGHLGPSTATPFVAPVSRATGGSRRKRRVVVPIVVAGSLALAGGVAFSLRGGVDKGAPTTLPTSEEALARPTLIPSSSPVADPTPPASARAQQTAPPSQATEATGATEAPVPSPSLPPPAPGRSPAAHAPTPPPRPTPGAARPVPAPALAKPPAVTKPDCSPSFVLDADGIKHFKPECF